MSWSSAVDSGELLYLRACLRISCITSRDAQLACSLRSMRSSSSRRRARYRYRGLGEASGRVCVCASSSNLTMNQSALPSPRDKAMSANDELIV